MEGKLFHDEHAALCEFLQRSLVVRFVLDCFLIFRMTITRRIIDIDQQAFERRPFLS